MNQSDFDQYNITHSLFSKEDSIIVAVSGGIDSITLLHLLVKSQSKKLAIAHCNFQLRGKEADADEQFVCDLAQHYGLPFFVTHFNTKQYATEQKISIQEAARQLRYSWFEKIRKENDFDWVAIGHNKNDVAETFLFNLVRGTGPAGLSGIKANIGTIIRPLLFATRQEIADFAHKHQLKYREDSSNRSEKYSRNFIRHKVLPLLSEINPQALNHIFETTTKINEIDNIANETIRDLTNRIMLKQNDKIAVSIPLLLKQKYSLTILHFILKDYGFSSKELPKILNALTHPGHEFLSSTHTLVIDRNYFYIFKTTPKNKTDTYTIHSFTYEITEPLSLIFRVVENTKDLKIKKYPRLAYLDFDKVSFPLTIRRWQNGDSFFPFGMKKKKKLSDYFIDLKFSILQKQEMWIMETNKEICWLIGERIDHRFAVTDNTKRILKIEKTEH